MKKRIFILFIVLLILFTSSALYYSLSLAKVNNKSNYNFIFVCPILDNEYWNTCIEGIKQADSELGTKTKLIGPQSAENFSTEILEYMEQAISEKPDGIIAYSGIDELAPLIEKATAQGIPVLSIDSDAPDSSRVAFVGTDAYNAGYCAGEKMIELTGGTAKIGILVSSKSAKKEMEVVSAFLDVTTDYNIEIVEIEETDADQDIAEKKTRELLKNHPDITAIFSTASYNVTGAAQVKKDLNQKNLILIGFDDIEENLKYVREGIINAIFVQKIKQIGYQSVYLMEEYLKNGSLSQKIYDAGTIIVTKDNVDTYQSNISKNITSKTVRLGYYNGNTSFQNGFDDVSRKSGYAYEYYQTIANIVGWNYEYVYGSKSEILDLLYDGKVDIVAGIYKTDKLKNTMLFSDFDMGMSGIKQYFVVNSQREDLLSDLNYAMEQISQSTPNYTSSLFQKYYSQAAHQILTDTEKEWLKNKNILKVGYVKHNLPLSDQGEDGNPTGVVKDLIDIMSQYMRIEIEPVCFETFTDMENNLKDGKIDTAFPIYSDLWLNESKGIRQTDAFINDRVMIIYKGNYSTDLMNRVALSQTGTTQKYYMSTYYPDSEIVFYDSRVEAFDAIKKGDERCSIGASSIIQHFLKEHPEYNDLNFAYLDTSENFGMAVQENDSYFLNILNKTIRQIDTATLISSMIKYSDVTNSYTFRNFIQYNSVLCVVLLTAFIAFLTIIFAFYLTKTKKYEKAQAKTNAALEKALKSANSANEAKTSFLSSISHDIRTPMNAIVGMTSIAYNHLDNREKIADCLEKIDLSSRHLLTLINNVLDLSKIENGKLQLNPVEFSLKDSINTMLDILQPQIISKNLQFETNICNLEYDMLYADEVRINQIFMNILTNAIKYTPADGKVTMSLSEKLLPDLKNVCITYIVEDTGMGMSEEFMKNMYTIFSRAEDSRINKIQGTGLGLAIVKQMVDIMEGSIDCVSKENEGSKFTITLNLPISTNTNSTVRNNNLSISKNENNNISGKHFLIAEDNDLNWEIISELLELYGITADRAKNGQICIDMLKSSAVGTYSLILMDNQMPIMSGREASQIIRKDSNDYVRNIPIIGMTADAFAEDILANIESGMNGHVSKPIDINMLFKEINRVLNENN